MCIRDRYKSYSLQAMAWLNGRLDLGQDYPWLELAVFQERYYVSFPPFPSLVPVSYTHLDVYKRQPWVRLPASCRRHRQFVCAPERENASICAACSLETDFAALVISAENCSNRLVSTASSPFQMAFDLSLIHI